MSENISAPGVKQTSGKARLGLLLDMPRALTAVAKVLEYGMAKGYPRAGYLTVNRGPELYRDALLRHLLAEVDDAHDEESGLLHAAHAACDALIRLELILLEDSTCTTGRSTPSDSPASPSSPSVLGGMGGAAIGGK